MMHDDIDLIVDQHSTTDAVELPKLASLLVLDWILSGSIIVAAEEVRPLVQAAGRHLDSFSLFLLIHTRMPLS
jgi:hypothetical protein